MEIKNTYFILLLYRISMLIIKIKFEFISNKLEKSLSLRNRILISLSFSKNNFY